MVKYIIIFAIILIVAVIVTWFLALTYRKNIVEKKNSEAEDRAREIIDEAVKNAEAKKKEILLEAKEESIKTKNDLDKEIKDRRNEVQRMEKRVISREENLDRKSEAIEKKEANLASREQDLEKQKANVEELEAKRLQELERISGLTSEQAKEYLLKTVEDEVKHETAMMIKEIEGQAKEEADKRAKNILGLAIQKCAAEIRELLASGSAGSIIRDGVRVVLAGKPNAGRSSLLNALLGIDRAIVSNIPGTTRDTLEERAVLRHIPVEITDTAGLRDADDEIEALIEKRQEARKNRDFATADAIRDELKAQGIILEDTAQGVKWHRA